MTLNKPIWKLSDWIMIYLLKNSDKINWSYLSANPSIFELDYEGIYEELIREVMKHSRVFKNPDYDYLEELFGD